MEKMNANIIGQQIAEKLGGKWKVVPATDSDGDAVADPWYARLYEGDGPHVMRLLIEYNRKDDSFRVSLCNLPDDRHGAISARDAIPYEKRNEISPPSARMSVKRDLFSLARDVERRVIVPGRQIWQWMLDKRQRDNDALAKINAVTDRLVDAWNAVERGDRTSLSRELYPRGFPEGVFVRSLRIFESNSVTVELSLTPDIAEKIGRLLRLGTVA